MKRKKKQKELYISKSTKMPQTLGNTVLMNTDILSKISFLPEDERKKITGNITKK